MMPGILLSVVTLLSGAQGSPPASTASQPLMLTVVVDVSASMLPPGKRWSTDAFVQGLEPSAIVRGVEDLAASLEGAERMRLARLGTSLEFLTDFAADRENLSRAARGFVDVPDSERHGPSAIWDTLAALADDRPPSGSRHAILLVTDGRSTGNRIRLAEALERLRGSDVMVSIVTPPAVVEAEMGGGRAMVVDPAVFMQRIADATGGILLRFKPADRFVHPLFKRALEHARGRPLGPAFALRATARQAGPRTPDPAPRTAHRAPRI